MNYGRAIRIARSMAGMSQAKLADRSQIDRSYLSLIESEKRTPSMETLLHISSSLNLPFHLLTLLATEKDEAKNLGHENVVNLATELMHLLLEQPQDHDQLSIDYAGDRKSKRPRIPAGSEKGSAA